MARLESNDDVMKLEGYPACVTNTPVKRKKFCNSYLFLKNSRDCRCNFELIVFSVINAGLPVVAVVLYILITQLGFNWPFTVAYADVHNNGDM